MRGDGYAADAHIATAHPMNARSAHPAPLPTQTDTTTAQPEHGPIVLYDGVCAVCDRGVQFVLRHDAERRFRFAALQSDFARRTLARHGRNSDALDTMCLLLDAGTPVERLLVKSDAILAVLRQLGDGWKLLAYAGFLPRAVRDRAYEAFVRRRYRWFGRYDSCALPAADVRERFIDSDPTGPLQERRANSPP